MYIEQGFVLNNTTNIDSDLSPVTMGEISETLSGSFADFLVAAQENDKSNAKKEDEVSGDPLMLLLSVPFLIPIVESKDIPENQSPDVLNSVKTDLDIPQETSLQVEQVVNEKDSGINPIDLAVQKTDQGIDPIDRAVQKTDQGVDPIDRTVQKTDQGIDLIDRAVQKTDQGNDLIDPVAQKTDPVFIPAAMLGVSDKLLNNPVTPINEDTNQQNVKSDVHIQLIQRAPEAEKKPLSSTQVKNSFPDLEEGSTDAEKQPLTKMDKESDIAIKPASVNDSESMLLNRSSINYEKLSPVSQKPETKTSITESAWNMSIEPQSLNKQMTDKITLHVNHKEAGEITAKIELINKESVVTFITENIEAQRTLQQNISQLKESFNESNLILAQTHMEQQTQQQERHSQSEKEPATGVQGRLVEEVKKIEAQNSNLRIKSVLDTFV